MARHYEDTDLDIRISHESRGRDAVHPIPYRRPQYNPIPAYRYGTTAYLAPEIGSGIRRSRSTGYRERSPAPPPAAPMAAPIIVDNSRHIHNDYSSDSDDSSIYSTRRARGRLSVGEEVRRKHRTHSRHVSISHSPGSSRERSSFTREDFELERTRGELMLIRMNQERERNERSVRDGGELARYRAESEREKHERLLREDIELRMTKGELERYKSERERERERENHERLLREETEFRTTKSELERYKSEQELQRRERQLREEFELLSLKEEKKRMEKEKRTHEEKERADKEIRDTYERMKRMEAERHAREEKQHEEAIEKYKREEAEKAARERKERDEIIEKFKRQEAERVARERAEREEREKEYQRRLHEDLHKAGLNEQQIVAVKSGKALPPPQAQMPHRPAPPPVMHAPPAHAHPPPAQQAPPTYQIQPAAPRPTYTRMARKHLSIETLRVYGIQYETDRDVCFLGFSPYLFSPLCIFSHISPSSPSSPLLPVSCPKPSSSSTPPLSQPPPPTNPLPPFQDPDYLLIKRWVPEEEQDILWAHTRQIRETRNPSHNHNSSSQHTIEYVKEYVIEDRDRHRRKHHHKGDDLQLVIERKHKRGHSHGSRSPSPFVRWAAGR